ncbi:medium-chain acyl-CoA ligase ACSF2, mitochondrial [Epargyreus clarus]|uniref:medium-chain acyl-CoA ligase ACSF2, mitochondrial n=1 Tax=Epargyreus clarus TaxID=520877 RepID=UPI003C2BBBD0
MNKNIVSVARRIAGCPGIISARSVHKAQDGYLHNPGTEPLTHSTLGDVIKDTAHKYPGRVAVKSIYENSTLTYEELLTKADSLGCALRANGFNKGDTLGIWSHNNVGWLVAVVAAARAGLISILINPIYEKNELSFCMKKAQLKGLVIGERYKTRNYYGTMNQIIPDLNKTKPGQIKSELFPNLSTIITCEKENLPGTFSLDSLTKDTGSGDAVSRYLSQVKPEDGCLVHFTSGTTGDPKGALDSHLGVVNNTYFIGQRNMLQERHQTVCVQVPLFHALGSIVTSLSALRHGSSLVLASPTYDVTSNLNALLAEKCTVITGTPTMYVDLLSQIKTKGSLPFNVEVALAAAAPCSPQLIRSINELLNAKSVKALYGLSETTASIFQSVDGDSVDLVAETVGYIQEHQEAKVVDENGNTLPFGSAGELVVRGYSNMICYWDEPEKTKQIIQEDGWLHTGDKFKISEDGYGRIVGRLKDIIIKGGENIAPKEIEDLLNTHPDIVESQVVGVPDERLGEELCAVLRIKDGATVTLDDIKRHCTGHLAKFKIPKILKVTTEFPKTASGKIQKFKIKDMIEAGKL